MNRCLLVNKSYLALWRMQIHVPQLKLLFQQRLPYSPNCCTALSALQGSSSVMWTRRFWLRARRSACRDIPELAASDITAIFWRENIYWHPKAIMCWSTHPKLQITDIRHRSIYRRKFWNSKFIKILRLSGFKETILPSLHPWISVSLPGSSLLVECQSHYVTHTEWCHRLCSLHVPFFQSSVIQSIF